jgi:hypothetical protein
MLINRIKLIVIIRAHTPYCKVRFLTKIILSKFTKFRNTGNTSAPMYDLS